MFAVNVVEATEPTMKTNIHPIERGVHIVAGVVLTSLAFVGPANLWLLLGLIPLVTGVVGWCPPYALFGFSTCSTQGSTPKAA